MDRKRAYRNSQVKGNRRMNALGRERMGLFVILALIVLLSIIFFRMVKIFLIPIILAATFTTLFYPFYKWLLKLFRNRKNLAAIICCLTLVILLFVPIYLIGHVVTLQAIELFTKAEPFIKELIEKGESGMLTDLLSNPMLDGLRLDEIDIQSSLMEAASTMGTFATTFINKTSKSVIGLVANLFIVIFTMFYFFRDGEKLVQRLVYLSPLRPIYEKQIQDRFVTVSRATIKGTVLIGIIQGSMGSLALLAFGIKSWILWGVVMILLSIIPMVGAWLVLLPIGITQILLGNIWQGVAIILISTLVISNIDNLIRPRLVGHEARLHDLIIFFSTLGGISLFGIMGFIVGPIVAALFITLLDIYGTEFRPMLTEKI